MLILVKLQASAYNFTKINTPPWVFFMFLKLYNWYQIAQLTTMGLQNHIILLLAHFTQLTFSFAHVTFFS